MTKRIVKVLAPASLVTDLMASDVQRLREEYSLEIDPLLIRSGDRVYRRVSCDPEILDEFIKNGDCADRKLNLLSYVACEYRDGEYAPEVAHE